MGIRTNYIGFVYKAPMSNFNNPFISTIEAVLDSLESCALMAIVEGLAVMFGMTSNKKNVVQLQI